MRWLRSTLSATQFLAAKFPKSHRWSAFHLPYLLCFFLRAGASIATSRLSAERVPSQSAADGLQSRQRAAPCGVCAGLGLAAQQKRVLTAIDRTRACNPARARGRAPAGSSSQAATAGGGCRQERADGRLKGQQLGAACHQERAGHQPCNLPWVTISSTNT
jgi:hypothetical protein